VINAVLVQRDGSILLGTDEAGVVRSTDQGRTWVASNTGFAERFALQLLFDPEGRLVVATWGAPRYGGVYMSGGIGRPWVHLYEGLERHQVLSVALLEGGILAGTEDGLFFRSPDAKSWEPLPVRIDGKVVKPRLAELLVLKSGTILAATRDGVIRSSDGGKTWTRSETANADIGALAVSPRNPNLVVAAGETGVFRSLNGGQSWRRVSLPLDVSLHALSFLPTDDRVVFATTTGGLFRSADRGATWRRVNGGVPHSDLTGLAIQPDGGAIYVSDFTWGGIFQSTDGGASWSRMPIDGLGSDRVWAMTIDPAAPQHLLAAPQREGCTSTCPLHRLVKNSPPASLLEPQRQAAQSAVHLLEFRHGERDRLGAQMLEGRERSGMLGRREDPVVHEDAVRGVGLRVVDREHSIARECTVSGECGDGDHAAVAHVREAALQVQDARHSSNIDGVGRDPKGGEERRELPRAFLVRALGQPDESVSIGLAHVASIQRPRVLDRNQTIVEPRERVPYGCDLASTARRRRPRQDGAAARENRCVLDERGIRMTGIGGESRQGEAAALQRYAIGLVLLERQGMVGGSQIGGRESIGEIRRRRPDDGVSEDGSAHPRLRT
jgi:photosystem II stability/assembly factor-like uncharacterized protein